MVWSLTFPLNSSSTFFRITLTLPWITKLVPDSELLNLGVLPLWSGSFLSQSTPCLFSQWIQVRSLLRCHLLREASCPVIKKKNRFPVIAISYSALFFFVPLQLVLLHMYLLSVSPLKFDNNATFSKSSLRVFYVPRNRIFQICYIFMCMDLLYYHAFPKW